MRIPDLFPQERPAQLWAGEELLQTFYCTPRDLEDLALGHLLGRGLLDPAAPPAVAVSPGEPWRMDVPSPSRQLGVSPPSLSPWRTTLPQLVELAQAVMENTPLRQKGGVHAAALLWEEDLIIREDVARHNAVDKAVGAGIIRGVDLSAAALFTTGRLSHEMIAKAAGAGIPMVVSMKYPTDLGAALAAREKICVVGKILSGAPVVYTQGWRLGLSQGTAEAEPQNHQ